MIAMTWIVPIMVFFTSIIGWQYFVGERTVKPGQCYVQYMDDAIFNCLLQVNAVLLLLYKQLCSPHMWSRNKINSR